MRRFFCVSCGRSYDTLECPKHKKIIDDVTTPDGYDFACEDALRRLTRSSHLVLSYRTPIFLLIFVLLFLLLPLPDVLLLAPLGKFFGVWLPPSIAPLLFLVLFFLLLPTLFPSILLLMKVGSAMTSPKGYVYVALPGLFMAKFFAERVRKVPFLLPMYFLLTEADYLPLAESYGEFLKKWLRRLFRVERSPLTLQEFLIEKGLIEATKVGRQEGQEQDLIGSSFGRPGAKDDKVYTILGYWKRLDEEDEQRKQQIQKGLALLKRDREVLPEKVRALADRPQGPASEEDEHFVIAYSSSAELLNDLERWTNIWTIVRRDPKYYKGLPKMVTNVLFFNLPWFEEWVLRKGKNVPPPWDERFLSQIPEGAKTRPVVGRPET